MLLTPVDACSALLFEGPNWGRKESKGLACTWGGERDNRSPCANWQPTKAAKHVLEGVGVNPPQARAQETKEASLLLKPCYSG